MNNNTGTLILKWLALIVGILIGIVLIVTVIKPLVGFSFSMLWGLSGFFSYILRIIIFIIFALAAILALVMLISWIIREFTD